MTRAWQSVTLGDGVHALAAGTGTPVVLLPGWPETAEAYSDIVPSLAELHQVLAVDPPGLGQSAAPAEGYDTGNVGRLLDTATRPSMPRPIHLVGHDVGAWIAYAWAAQFPERIKSLTLLDSAPPGVTPPQSFPLPFQVNVKMWQFSFNTLPDLPEILTQGHERELLEWLFQHKAEHPERISRASRDFYVECYARSGAMSRGFAYYRAAAKSASQNIEFSQTKLQMPVLALGGESGVGDSLRQSMEKLAVNVQGGELENCGHFVMEEQPEMVARHLLEFFEYVENANQ